MDPKADPEAMSEKGFKKGFQIRPFWHHFVSQNRPKIDAKIDAEKVMKNDEKMMQKMIKSISSQCRKLVGNLTEVSAIPNT